MAGYFDNPCVWVGMLISLAALAFWVWMLVDCLTNPSLRDMEKLIWVLVIIFLSFLGALLYFLIKRSQKLSV